MIDFNLQLPQETLDLTAIRGGETKLGQTVSHCKSIEVLHKSKASFVIFGIAEDIGVRANYGKKGTDLAWQAFVKAFVNVQENQTNFGRQMLLLGHFSVAPVQQLEPENLGPFVIEIDAKVSQLVQLIVSQGKIPIIIGGGHNNAYGNLKGASSALKKPINALNIDAHTDLRKTDYRHSGNGFTYALKGEDHKTYLDKYLIFGLHDNYTPQYIYDFIKAQEAQISYYAFEKMLSQDLQLRQFDEAIQHIAQQTFGLEIDCDAIAQFPSSAQSPSGFDLQTIRALITKASSYDNCCYLHLCEAAPTNDPKNQVGKALSYMVTDFIRNYGNR